jgi:hypothetical protein
LEQAARGSEVERVEPLADALLEAINRYFAHVAGALS